MTTPDRIVERAKLILENDTQFIGSAAQAARVDDGLIDSRALILNPRILNIETARFMLMVSLADALIFRATIEIAKEESDDSN